MQCQLSFWQLHVSLIFYFSANQAMHQCQRTWPRWDCFNNSIPSSWQQMQFFIQILKLGWKIYQNAPVWRNGFCDCSVRPWKQVKLLVISELMWWSMMRFPFCGRARQRQFFQSNAEGDDSMESDFECDCSIFDLITVGKASSWQQVSMQGNNHTGIAMP